VILQKNNLNDLIRISTGPPDRSGELNNWLGTYISSKGNPKVKEDFNALIYGLHKTIITDLKTQVEQQNALNRDLDYYANVQKQSNTKNNTELSNFMEFQIATGRKQPAFANKDKVGSNDEIPNIVTATGKFQIAKTNTTKLANPPTQGSGNPKTFAALNTGQNISYFRSPLTMSNALYQSLGNIEANRIPLILPGNPLVGNTEPITLTTTQKIPKGTNIQKNYKEIINLVQDPSSRDLSEHTFFARQISKRMGATSGSASTTTTQKSEQKNKNLTRWNKKKFMQIQMMKWMMFSIRVHHQQKCLANKLEIIGK